MHSGVGDRPGTESRVLAVALSTRRIEAFSDGVLSVVITLLVLQLSLPIASTGASEPELTRLFVESIPKIFSYVISFAVVGIFWVAHHNLFHFIIRADRVLLWLNNLVSAPCRPYSLLCGFTRCIRDAKNCSNRLWGKPGSDGAGFGAHLVACDT
jgi:hypothetical protein